MTFLHPWAIWVGVAAAAVPVLIHVLTRPRPIRLPLSTLRFVREAVRQRRTWRRLRDYILLALRTLAVLLIALAVARPQWGSRRQIADLASGDTVRVVVLDLSQSMAARTGAVELFERARTAAAGYLRYRPGLAADLILAGARPRGVFDGPSTNFDALRDELSRCRVLPQRMDVNRALDLAARMLAPASPEDHRRRELVVVSDFQRSRWSRADFAPLPADTQIQFESTAPAVAPANLAVLRVEGRAAGAQGNVQLEVEVANYSPATRKMAVNVALGHSSWRLSGTCLPGRSTTLVEETGPRPPGWEWGEARLVGVGVDDALAADNVRPFVLQVRPPPRYVLITRQAASRRPTSSLFLECRAGAAWWCGRPACRRWWCGRPACRHRNAGETPAPQRRPVARRRARRPGGARPAGGRRGRSDSLGPSGNTAGGDDQAALGADASRAADPLRRGRGDRRHEPQAAERGGRQRIGDAGRVCATARRPGAARFVLHRGAA